MEEKIGFHLFFMGLLSAVAAVILSATVFYSSFEQQVSRDLKNAAAIITESYAHLEDAAEVQAFATDQLRVTLISPEGAVLSESAAEAGGMGNHLERPEIAGALANGSGESRRRSDTLASTVYYYAVLLPDGNVLRVSMAAGGMEAAYAAAFPYLFGILCLIIAAAVLLALLLTRKLLRPIKALAGDIDNLELLRDEKQVYPELVPFVQEIQAQRLRISRQLRAIEEEKNKLTAIMQHMSEGLLILDMNRKVLMSNGSARDYLAAPNSDENENILYFTRNPELNECVAAAIDGGSLAQYVTIGSRQLQVMASPVMNDGQQEGVICLILDETDKRRMEKMKQEFTANVSHELKTPLTSISGYAEMIETGIAQPEDVTRFAARIHKEAGRLLGLIRDIIKLSELDEGREEPAFEQVALQPLAEECAAILQPTAERQEVTFTIEGEGDTVEGDRGLLFELLYNLCDNAIRYNRPGGRVTVTLGERFLSVSDTGIGIPEKHQARIFERFYRVDKSRSQATGGTGLGLAIVKHIAERHHAAIELNSCEGSGTTITVRFHKT